MSEHELAALGLGNVRAADAADLERAVLQEALGAAPGADPGQQDDLLGVAAAPAGAAPGAAHDRDGEAAPLLPLNLAQTRARLRALLNELRGLQQALHSGEGDSGEGDEGDVGEGEEDQQDGSGEDQDPAARKRALQGSGTSAGAAGTSSGRSASGGRGGRRGGRSDTGRGRGGGRGGRGGRGGAGAPAAPDGALSRAMMEQRIAGLRQERARLEAHLAALQRQSHRRLANALGGPAASLLEGEGDDGEQAKGPAKKVQLIEDMDLFGDSEEGEEELEGGSGKGGVTHPLMETERDRMIRQGLITPFGSLSGYEKRAAGGAVGARTGLARIGAAAGLGPGKAGAPKGAAKPFDRAPIADLMEREGRAGKPLAQLMEEASSKSKQAVAARHATQVMDAEQAIDELRDVRKIPAVFWRNAASGKRLPNRHPDLPAAGTIPGLGAGRAPLPPLNKKSKKKKRQTDEDGRGRRRKRSRRGDGSEEEVVDVVSSEDEDMEIDGEGPEPPGSADGDDQQPDHNIPAASGDQQQGGQPQQPRPDGGMDARERAAVIAAASGRAAARKALQRMAEQSTSDDNEGEEEEEGGRGANRSRGGRSNGQRAGRQARQQGSRRGRQAAGSDDDDEEENMSDESSEYLPSEDEEEGAAAGRRRRRGRQGGNRGAHAQEGAAADQDAIDLTRSTDTSNDAANDAEPRRASQRQRERAVSSRRAAQGGRGSDEDEDSEDGLDWVRAQQARQRAARRGRLRQAGAPVSPRGHGEGGRGRRQRDSAEDEETSDGGVSLEDEEEGVLGEGAGGGRGGGNRQRRRRGSSVSTESNDSDEGRQGDAEDLTARFDDDDDDFYMRRVAEARVRIQREDAEVAEAEAAAEAAAAEVAAAGLESGGVKLEVKEEQAADAAVGVVHHNPLVAGHQGATGAGHHQAVNPPVTEHQPAVKQEVLVKQEPGVDEAAAGPGPSGAPGVVDLTDRSADGAGPGPGSTAAAGPAGAGGRGGRGASSASRGRGRQGRGAGGAPAANGHGQAAGEDGNGPAQPSPYVEFEGGLRVPLRVWAALFEYQRTGLQWLWELHCQQAGGILGDEMGLGKTVQIAALLAGLHNSGVYRPSLILCPATVLRQWVRELRRWAPALRCLVFHESMRAPGIAYGGSGAPRSDRAALVAKALSDPAGLLITTYEQLRLHRNTLLRARWGYAILDEGHKIRNPDSEVTLVAKQLNTVHRIVVTGSPIQNRLSELWSLFDFIYPGKLGTLPVFQAQFSVPIQVGGYTNATQVQVNTAYRCALVLRDLVAPHLLRRRKVDVQAQLPRKTEQVLFCPLTSEQLALYRSYLASTEVAEILEGGRQALAGIDILRKICNHPDLLERLTSAGAEDYGSPDRSGKLSVTARLLTHWAAGGHKALLFCQTRQMLDICEKLVTQLKLTYHRMDGGTTISLRSRLIDDFNNNPDIQVFLLTTKVGGLGVNLVGADRVLLYDPDFNPAADAQARERAWRIGQTREVVVYRLITGGTIEEKIYHRQVYKSFLTNKVLKDPRQKRFFAAKDLHDLFTLGEEYGGGKAKSKASAAGQQQNGAGTAARPPETARIFNDAGHDIMVDPMGVGEDGLLDGAGKIGVAGEGAGIGRVSANGSDINGSVMSHGRAGSPAPRAVPGGTSSAPGVGGTSAGSRPSTPGAPGRAGTSGASGSGRGAAASKQQQHRLANGRSAAGSNGVRRVKAEPGTEEAEEGDGSGERDEARILRDLFEGKSLQSLVDHNRVEHANEPEAIAADQEAARVAARAAEALRRSRAECARAPINQPTWTGRHGHSGAPGGGGSGPHGPSPLGGSSNQNGAGGSGSGGGAAGKPRFGTVVAGRAGAGNVAGGGTGAGRPPLPRGTAAVSNSSSGNGNGREGSPAGSRPAGGSMSSAALLAQARARQAGPSSTRHDSGGGSGESSSGGGAGVQRDSEEADLLAARIVSFLDAQKPGREADSGTVVAAFRTAVPQDGMPLFRQLLHEVATLQKRNGKGMWVLKKEFWSQEGGG